MVIKWVAIISDIRFSSHQEEGGEDGKRVMPALASRRFLECAA